MGLPGISAMDDECTATHGELRVQLDLPPGHYTLAWRDPIDGRVISTSTVAPRDGAGVWVTAPEFACDILGQVQPSPEAREAAEGPEAAAPLRTCEMSKYAGLPFCNASMSVDERVADLVQRATLAELQAQLLLGPDDTPGIPRLGVPPMGTAEALHGVCTALESKQVRLPV